MATKNYLEGKKILLVDDEPDILETLEDLLASHETTRARSFEKAKELLETQSFDLAILDIMGVDGFKLLKIAKKRKVIGVMLTAHALSPETTLRSFREGAAFYVPKEKLIDIVTYLNDVFEIQAKGKHFWHRWVERFGPFYNRKFGPNWRKPDRGMWEQLEHNKFEGLKHYYMPR